MSIDCDICDMKLLLTIPAAVELSVCIIVGGWGCPNSINESQIISPILFVLNNPPNYDSDFDATTCLSMLHIVCISPLVFISYVFLGRITKK